VSEKRQGKILLESGTNEVEILEFYVGDQPFGVNVAKVTQALVWKDQKVTSLPSAPQTVLGSVYFRDTPISVIDLRELLELSQENVNLETQLLLVMEFNGKMFGFVIDSINGILRVSWKDFQPIDQNLRVEDDSAVTGTVTQSDRIILILDIEALVAKIDPSISLESYLSKVNLKGEVDRSTVKVVYAEDSMVVQKKTTELLHQAGFTDVRSFTTGQQAFDFLTSAKPSEVDIILSDIEMPEMDGLTLCKQVRTQTPHHAVPFVFYSSLINEQMKVKCASVGGNASFSKPEVHQIVDALEQLYKEASGQID